VCAGVCPGLAIFIVDETVGDGLGTVTLPYEFSPLPDKGDVVFAIDRAGNRVTEATVVRINQSKRTKTCLLTISVPLEHVHDVRFIRLPRCETTVNLLDEPSVTSASDQQDEETIICRCEGITRKEIRQLIREGYTTVDEIKRVSRAGMGPCQARTCGPLIAGEIARMTGIPIEEVEPSAHRPPTKSLPISFFMEDE
ncbi:MAG TPA: (2Fe-2S)-binding protein, partial [Clostridia bacterium]|nr:(2Fe-2S)-binding protein [Clostridia bacterium]